MRILHEGIDQLDGAGGGSTTPKKNFMRNLLGISQTKYLTKKKKKIFFRGIWNFVEKNHGSFIEKMS
jgi:hypothetical protein